jgi:hypothetical protein
MNFFVDSSPFSDAHSEIKRLAEEDEEEEAIMAAIYGQAI